MSTDEILAEMDREAARTERLRAFILANKEKLDALNLPLSRWQEHIDFDRLKHQDTIKVIQTFPGKWDKTPSHNGDRIDYQTKVEGVILRVWAGEPPPTCRIVEEEVFIPARVEKRRKMVCTEPVEQAPAAEPTPAIESEVAS